MNGCLEFIYLFAQFSYCSDGLKKKKNRYLLPGDGKHQQLSIDYNKEEKGHYRRDKEQWWEDRKGLVPISTDTCFTRHKQQGTLPWVDLLPQLQRAYL